MINTLPLQIACMNLSEFERQCLVRVVKNRWRPCKIKDIQISPCIHKQCDFDHFDVIFFSLEENGKSPELRRIQCLAAEAMFVLFVKEGGEYIESLEKGVNEVFIYNDSNINMYKMINNIVSAAEGKKDYIMPRIC